MCASPCGNTGGASHRVLPVGEITGGDRQWRDAKFPVVSNGVARAGQEPGLGGDFTVSLENVPATQRKAMPVDGSGDEAAPRGNTGRALGR